MIMRWIAVAGIVGALTSTGWAAPPVGHPSAIETNQMLNGPAAAAGTLQGKVAEVIDTNMYSYVRVTIDTQERWLAIPQTPLAVGDEVRFSPGTLMSNFYSKSLRRTFPEVYFLGGVEKVAGAAPAAAVSDPTAAATAAAPAAAAATAAPAAAAVVSAPAAAVPAAPAAPPQ